MIRTIFTRLGGVATAFYLVFWNPTLLGPGTPLFAVAIGLLLLLDVSGVGFSGGGVA